MTFEDRYGPWAIVAGASEGIGQAWCRRLAERGLNVFLIARREGPLRAEAAEIEGRTGVRTAVLAADLSVPDAALRIAAATRDLDVGFLVYNAAYAEVSEFLSQSDDSHRRTVDLNCRGVLLLTQAVANRLVARGRGGIVLMSSMSGWQGSALMSTYGASKAFITVFGESLWSELRPLGVDVQVCVAGATRTPNFLARTPESKQRGAFPMAPDAVVDASLARLGKGPTAIAGGVNRAVHIILNKLAPRSAAIRFFSRTVRGMYEGGS
ncbi:MAG: SDR family NAD(P)-dependent oxidoreductase [Myxococcota bacterium]